MTLLLTLTICTVPVEDAVPFHADVVDVNRVYCAADGKLLLTQLVWLSWNGESHEINAWRVLKPGMEPIRVGKFYVVVWFDGDTMRVVYSRSRLKSWGLTDYEADARVKLPECRRRGLGK